MRKKYEYYYDKLCDHFDKIAEERNCCQFKDGKCRRNWEGGFSGASCCDLVRDQKIPGGIDFSPECPLVGPNGCTTKNLTCKLFYCSYLTKKGIKKLNVETYKGINKIFNEKQRWILDTASRKTREQVIDKLLEVKDDKTPFLWFILTKKYRIKD